MQKRENSKGTWVTSNRWKPKGVGGKASEKSRAEKRDKNRKEKKSGVVRTKKMEINETKGSGCTSYQGERGRVEPQGTRKGD